MSDGESATRGDRIAFVEEPADPTGDPLEYELTVPAGEAVSGGRHVHPYAEEWFTVAAGRMKATVGGTERVLGTGDRMTVPSGEPHAWENRTEDGELRVRAELRPGRSARETIEARRALPPERLAADGEPDLWQTATFVRAGLDDFARASPSVAAQNLFAALLGPVAKLRGYRVRYDD